MPKDIVKQELAVGDVIAFNPPRVKGLVIGTIDRLTEKTVRASYKQEWTTSSGTFHSIKRECQRSIKEVIKVDPAYAVLFYLSK